MSELFSVAAGRIDAHYPQLEELSFSSLIISPPRSGHAPVSTLCVHEPGVSTRNTYIIVQ